MIFKILGGVAGVKFDLVFPFKVGFYGKTEASKKCPKFEKSSKIILDILMALEIICFLRI